MKSSALQRASSLLLLFVPLLSLTGVGFASADAIVNGVTVKVYNNYGYNAAPPIPPNRPLVGTFVQPNIENNFDEKPLFQMYEDFMVQYEGFITAPCTCNVEFMAQADDGTKLYLDGVLITNDWRDKGGGGSVSQPVPFEEGVSKQITLWFYENGGGAWVQLWWMVQNQWEIIPATAFTVQAAPETTTTTTTTTTTSTTTTTTEPPTTTTEAPTTSTEAPTTTSTTTTSTTTTTTTTTTTVPEPVTTTTNAMRLTTTTTEVPIATTTQPSTTTEPPSPTTTIPEQVTPAEVQAAVEALTELDSKEVTVDDFAAVLDPEIAEELSPEQVDAIVDVIVEVVDNLTDTELVALAETLSAAPDSVKESFEAQVDVFGGKFDTYVPSGSVISVGKRRAVNAVIATVMAAPAAAGASSSSSQRKK